MKVTVDIGDGGWASRYGYLLGTVGACRPSHVAATHLTFLVSVRPTPDEYG
ncbi:MAG: hypothetical protein M3436_20715 [Pseudomonadota bacterium]|nr:hypothetical protein [Pseudomonadota bacterium]